MNSRIAAFVGRVDGVIMKIGHVLTVLFAVVVAISFYEVVMRYVFDAPTSWVHETTTFLISLSLIYGGVYCYSADRHIAMTFIVDFLGPKTKWCIQFVVNNLMMIFITMLLYGSYLSAGDAFFRPNGKFHMQTSGSAIDTPFPALSKGFFFVSCIVLLVLVVLHYVRHIAVAKSVFDGTYVEPDKGEEE